MENRKTKKNQKERQSNTKNNLWNTTPEKKTQLSVGVLIEENKANSLYSQAVFMLCK